MAVRLKNRMRQAVDMGRIWTAGYYDSLLFTDPAVIAHRRYIAGHAGCRMSGGVCLR